VNASEELLSGIVRVFTRGRTTGVLVRIHDSSGLPPYDISINLRDLAQLLEDSDISALSIKELLDLGSLYYTPLKNALDAEFQRRAELDPDFRNRLTAELLPRLRKLDDPGWRYGQT
jgi:hypothetical protein